MKKILICTQNYYTSKYQVGSHNYARTFENLGYKVAFISNPISPLHSIFAKNESLATRENIYRSEGVTIENMWYYLPKTYITPHNRFILKSEFVFQNWYKFASRNILTLLKEKKFDSVDILWIESPYYHFMLDKIRYKKSIFRIADFSQGFKSTWDFYYQKEIEIANRVDTIIYTAKNIKEQYQNIKDKSKMLYMPNGIDLESMTLSNKELPDEYNNIPSPRVLYIGMIDYWFDVELVCKCAHFFPNYSFVLIGDANIDLSKLKKHSNIYLLGAKPHQEISQYLSHSDAGIIPFIKDDFVDSINPIKLYEYCAYSLKIVATRWKEVEELSDLFSICEDSESFINALKELHIPNKKNTQQWLELQDWKIKVQKVINF